MAKLEIIIEDKTLQEAEKVLHSIGMNADIAISIFLRRVAIEKGLPMTMAAPVSRDETPDDSEDINDMIDSDSIQATRSNHKITPVMLEEVWNSFLKILEGSGRINRLSNEVSAKTGMSRGSAFIYLSVLTNLAKGEPNTRTMKMQDLEYFMGKIKTELGDKKHQDAIKSLKMSVPYWQEKLSGRFGDKVDEYCKKHS